MATATRTIADTVYKPDSGLPWDAAIIAFDLQSDLARNDDGVIGQSHFTATTDIDGLFSVDLTVPSDSELSYRYRCTWPDGQRFAFWLGPGDPTSLRELLAVNVPGDEVGDDLTQLIALHAADPDAHHDPVTLAAGEDALTLAEQAIGLDQTQISITPVQAGADPAGTAVTEVTTHAGGQYHVVHALANIPDQENSYVNDVMLALETAGLIAYDGTESWDLRDEFSDDRAAGEIDGKLATDGVNTRTVVDASSFLSTSSGKLGWSEHGGVGNPALVYPEQQREPGLLLLSEITSTDTSKNGPRAGYVLSNSTFSTPNWAHVLGFSPSNLYYYNYSNSTLSVYTGLLADTSLPMTLALRASGVFVMAEIEGIYRLLFVDNLRTDAAMYPAFLSATTSTHEATADYIRIPKTRWLPVPQRSDDFSTVPTAVDSGSNGLDGAYTNVGLGGPGVGAKFNGSSFVNLYSTAFETFVGDNQVGTVVAGVSIPSESWTNGTQETFFYVRSSNNDLLHTYKDTGNNLIRGYYTAGGVTKGIAKTGISVGGNQFTVATTWEYSGANEMSVYFDGAIVNSETGIGQWSGSLLSGNCVIGASNTSLSAAVTGSIQHFILGKTRADDADVLSIDAAIKSDTLTTTILDGIFGAGNYQWLKLDEQYATNGLGHAEGIAGGLGSGGAGVTWNGPTWYNDGSDMMHNAPTLGANILNDPGMELDDGSWTDHSSPTTNEQSATQANSGTYSRHVASAVAGSGATQSVTIEGIGAGVWVELRGSSYVVAGLTRIKLLTSRVLYDNYISFDTGSWVEKSSTNRYISDGSVAVYLRGGVNDYEGYFDDVSVKKLNTADLFYTTDDRGTPYTYDDGNWVIEAGTQAGFVTCLDDIANPQNFLLAHCDTVSMFVEKCVAGVYTTLATVAITYDANARFSYRTTRSGADIDLWVWYGVEGSEVKVGNWTVTDAGITSNTIHGLFSTDPRNACTKVVEYDVEGHVIPGTQ